MQLFIYEPAYRRLQAQIHAICPDVRPILMGDDCRIVLEGRELTPEEFCPDIAWISTDVFFTPATRDFLGLLAKCPPLKWVQSAAAGVDLPIFQTIGKKTEIYTNSNGAAKSIAEFVFANVIALFHPHQARREAQAERAWKRLGFGDIADSQWMIIGYGNIGQEIGKRALAFEAQVTGVRRNPSGHEQASAMISPGAALDVLPQMDVVVLAADSNETSHHLVNADFLSRMKAGSILVNIARGALIDEAALLRSLDQGRPAYAVLDVFEQEPLPEDSPFWDHPNVLLSAHCAASSPLTRPRGDAVFLRNLSHFVLNQPLELRINF